MKWNVNLQSVGRGKKAIRYLAAYVKKSAFSEKRLLGYNRRVDPDELARFQR